MKVFHEAPISIMEDIAIYLSGDYCLPHLLDENNEYREYFYKAKHKNRYIIMDNSMHELGYPYNEEKLIKWVYELKPNEFIVPDVLGNSSQTILLANEWIKKSLPKETKKVAVIQAQHEGDFYIQYVHYKDLGYDKICIPYGLKVYETIFPHPNKWVSRTMGRIYIIIQLLNKGFIKENDKIHLLGCNLNWEFKFYKDIPQIESVDTSNPVMATIENPEVHYPHLNHKPKINLMECFELPKEKLPLPDIIYNINSFKNINKHI